MSTESKFQPLICHGVSMLTWLCSGRADWVWLERKGQVDDLH